MDVKEEDILGDHIAEPWYYAAKGRALRRFLQGAHPSAILDVGAGSGVFSKLLLADGAREAVCVDPEYRHEQTLRVDGKPMSFRRAIESSTADLVLMMDVCEHVDDDVGLIAHYARLVAPGTRFLITVPAFQFLFSGHDLFLEHKRRYTLASLEACVAASGLEVRRSAYYFAAVFPLAAAQRLAERALVRRGALAPKSSLRRHHPLVNGVLKAACAAELPWFAHNRLFGLSVFCLARKP